jgi:hypothetical protein
MDRLKVVVILAAVFAGIMKEVLFKNGLWMLSNDWISLLYCTL